MKRDFEKRFSDDQSQLEQILDHNTENGAQAPLLLTRLRYFRRILDALEGRGPEI